MERDELGAWLRLTQVPGIGAAAARRLLAALGPPRAVLDAPFETWVTLLGPARAQVLADGAGSAALAQQLQRTWDWLQHHPAHDVLVLGDVDYPPGLLAMADPPLLLYLIGQRELLNQRPGLAIVGSRHPTPQGRDNARGFARELGTAGLSIVSGLALGIDSAAHEGALAAAAPTLAVLGTGVDLIYPPQNLGLAQRISQQGLLISEYPLGTPPLAANFPKRNRLIAGLSVGCLVVEAALRSGSLITARLAAEAGREVFAIPGSIHSAQSHGCHELLRQGAALVESAQDVLAELKLAPPHAAAASTEHGESSADTAAGLDDAAERVLTAMGFEPVGLDALMARGGWPADQLNALLLDLELAGRVARLPGQLFQRRRQA